MASNSSSRRHRRRPATNSPAGLKRRPLHFEALEDRLLLSTVGLYRPSTSSFFLTNSHAPGAADLTFHFGPANSGWTPLVGDWDGNSSETAGLFKPSASQFFLKNSHAGGAADLVFGFGPTESGWTPLAGDWDGDGTTTVGLFSPSSSTFYLKNSHAPGGADFTFRFGPVASGWTPVIGDWDGDGVDTVGLYKPTSSTFYLKNSHAPGGADVTFRFGPIASGWTPLASDWDGDGIDTVGFHKPSTSSFFLKNEHSPGAADLVFRYGPAASDWRPLAGDWNGSDLFGFGPGIPGSLLTLNGAGFDPNATLQLRFTDSSGFTVDVPAIDATANTVTAAVPPFIDPTTGALLSGTVDVNVVQNSAILGSGALTDFAIRPLPTPGVPKGQATLSFLQMAANQAQQLQSDILGTVLDTPEMNTQLANQLTHLNSTITNVSNVIANPNQTFSLGTLGGNPLTVGMGDLADVDRLVLGMLLAQATTVDFGSSALVSHSASTSSFAVSSGACNQQQADAYTRAMLDGDSIGTGQFGAARDAYGSGWGSCATEGTKKGLKVVLGSGGLAVGIMSGLGVPASALALPKAALGYIATVGGGLMATISASFNDPQGVLDGFNKIFSVPKSVVEDVVLPNLVGAVKNIYEGMNDLIVAFDQAVDPPTPPPPTCQPGDVCQFDGSYVGSYIGTAFPFDRQFPPFPVSGGVAFTVSNGSVSVTAPDNGSGTVSASGSASIGTAGGSLGDCTFTGTLVPSGGSVSATGTWSCTTPAGTASGTWSASRTGALPSTNLAESDPTSLETQNESPHLLLETAVAELTEEWLADPFLPTV